MSKLYKIKSLFLLAVRPQIFMCRASYLLIIGHMRSRSSLLAHILGSHPDISGYTELHQSYIRELDLMKLRALVYLKTKDRLQDKYLLDQIVHDSHRISGKVIEAARPKIIFLLREPERTLKSLYNLGRLTGLEWCKDPAHALGHYCGRLSTMEDYARKFGQGAFFVESDELVNNPDRLLNELSAWLQLSTKLDKNYTIFNKTGRPGRGDPSSAIKSRTIIKTKGDEEIDIPPEILQTGREAYETCKTVLSENVKSAGIVV